MLFLDFIAIPWTPLVEDTAPKKAILLQTDFPDLPWS